MPPNPSERRIRTSSPLTTLRRISGSTADRLFVHCQPIAAHHDAAGQAATVYEDLLGVLDAEGVSPECLVSETLFLRRLPDDLSAVRAARSRLLGAAGLRDGGAAATFIGQAPLDEFARLELSASAFVPHAGVTVAAGEVVHPSACSCEECSPGVRARVVRAGDETHVFAANILGAGRTPFEQAAAMFEVAEGLLADVGMTFGNVIRTWIHLRDIDRDYAALNQARREFFARCGLEQRPASTGVQGAPSSAVHEVSLSLYAMASPQPPDVTVMSTPTLNEAWSYGADFSRGLRLAQADLVTLFVSGTASLDERGRSVHTGDFRAQVDRMLRNVETLLAQRGARSADLVSGITYLKHPTDGPVLRAMLRERGFGDFPNALVHAPLCRPELLCELEGIAMLPLTRGGE